MRWLKRRRRKRKPVFPDHLGRIFVDLPCKTCGYNLRGLSFEGACPECGSPVADTIDDTPAPLPQQTLQRARLASLCLIVPVALLLLGGLGYSLISERFLFMSRDPAKAFPLLLSALWVVKVAELLSLLLAIYAQFILSRPPPALVNRVKVMVVVSFSQICHC